VISQRISKAQAAVVQLWLARNHGTALEVTGATVHSFPTPAQLLLVGEAPGLSRQKLKRLRGVAEAAISGILGVDRLLEAGEVRGPEALRAIPGIGPFWSQGIYLRSCGSLTR